MLPTTVKFLENQISATMRDLRSVSEPMFTFGPIATSLVQRYGYLLPKLNPKSDLAKEQELLRVRSARNGLHRPRRRGTRRRLRQKAPQDFQKASAACDAQRNQAPVIACERKPSTRRAGTRTLVRDAKIETPLLGILPPDQDFQSVPRGRGYPLQRAQLMQMQTGGMPLAEWTHPGFPVFDGWFLLAALHFPRGRCRWD